MQSPTHNQPPRLGHWLGAGFLAGTLLAMGRATPVVLRFYGTGGLGDQTLSQGYACFLASLWIAAPILILSAGLCVHRPGLRWPLFLLAGSVSLAWIAHWLPYDSVFAPSLEGWRGRGLICSLGLVAAASAAVGVWGSGESRVAKTGGGVAAALSITVLALHLGADRSPSCWPERPNLILISLDTLRADRLGSYGSDLGATPNLDAFAQHAVRFENAYSAAPSTLPSHMTMLTGLSPSRHGVTRDLGLPAELPTLPELLKEEGYATLAVVDTCVWLTGRFGFTRGFDLYRRVAEPTQAKAEQALEVLDLVQGTPFFLFFHTYDAHSDMHGLPYHAAPSDRERYAGWYQGDFDGCNEEGVCASEYLWLLNERGDLPAPAERRFIECLYDAGVRTLDRDLALLFDGLRARGLLENSVIAITADHGEEFFEHGKALHASYYAECTTVPLLVRTPDTPEQLGTAAPLVSHVDLLRTFLDYAGGSEPSPSSDFAASAGRSLRPWLEGGTGPERPFMPFDRFGRLLALRTPEAAVVRTRGEWFLERESGTLPLEDVPSEEREGWMTWIGTEEAELASAMARIGRTSKRSRVQRPTATEDRELRSLGYTGDD
ncbi:MAG TPA: sulfatase [Planctomycetota bacterium]|nr:sulfatase [Planctomycetota bacterium]